MNATGDVPDIKSMHYLTAHNEEASSASKLEKNKKHEFKKRMPPCKVGPHLPNHPVQEIELSYTANHVIYPHASGPHTVTAQDGEICAVSFPGAA